MNKHVSSTQHCRTATHPKVLTDSKVCSVLETLFFLSDICLIYKDNFVTKEKLQNKMWDLSMTVETSIQAWCPPPPPPLPPFDHV